MLNLKKVSKFYHKKGIVTSGFSKITLDFNINEFVVITGASGSGKSTLLNVISGLDSYEEGEMYINGVETSGYTKEDLEEYRKKYVANIYQSFNLINSYTVYQNIELVLLTSGIHDSEKIEEVIRKVELTKYRNTKVSKLSGGQKQRVAIARALVKDTPIIIADEPTGNLDTESSENILEILHNLSKDKLVIVVTHNYEEVKKYATRKIRMNDGKIVEDTIIKKIDKDLKIISKDAGSFNVKDIFKLGIRNSFNVPGKFILLFAVYLFMVFSLLSSISTRNVSQDAILENGYNTYFNNLSEKRYIVKKEDIDKKDMEDIMNIDNVEYVVENDFYLDLNVNLESLDTCLYGRFENLDYLDLKLTAGVMPIAENEIVVSGGNYSVNEGLIGVHLNNYNDLNYDYIVTGVIEENDYFDSNIVFYASDTGIKRFIDNSGVINNEVSVKFDDNSDIHVDIISNEKVEEGYIYILENNGSFNTAEFTIKKLLSTSKKEMKVKTYSEDDSIFSNNEYPNVYWVNPKDYREIYLYDNSQVSVFVDNSKIDITSELAELGFESVKVTSLLEDPIGEISEVLDIFKTIGYIINVIVMFFISYFIIKIILKSRNIYYSTIRMLGARQSDSKNLLIVDLLTCLNSAFIIVFGFILLVYFKIIDISYLYDLVTSLSLLNYITVYITLTLMSILQSVRYARKSFSESAISSYKEEV